MDRSRRWMEAVSPALLLTSVGAVLLVVTFAHVPGERYHQQDGTDRCQEQGGRHCLHPAPRSVHFFFVLLNLNPNHASPGDCTHSHVETPEDAKQRTSPQAIA